MEDRRIHVGYTRRFRGPDGHTEITVNLSGLTETMSDSGIREMMRTANSALSIVEHDIDARVRGTVAISAPAPVESPEATQIDISSFFKGDDDHGAAAPVEKPEPPVVPVAGAAVEIPRDEDVQVYQYREVFGVQVREPAREWLVEPIGDTEGHNQLVALNASFSALKITGTQRHRACEAILTAFGSLGDFGPRFVVSSTRDLSKGEASILLNWIENADEPAVETLWAAIGQPSLPEAPEPIATISAAEAALLEEVEDPFIDPELFPEDSKGAAGSADPQNPEESWAMKTLGVPEQVEGDDFIITPAATQEEEEEELPKPELVLSDDQTRALDRCLEAIRNRENAFLFVTGKAGTGKSTILRELRKRRRIIIVAPTGLAAVNVGGQTIHSFFGLKTGPLTRGNVNAMRYPDLLEFADAVVIDEVSMVRADLLDGINACMQKTLHNLLPFGGKPVIAFGDLMQLEPVVTDEESEFIKKRYSSPFWFEARVFQKAAQANLVDDEDERIQIEKFELEHVFRQNDQEFVDALNCIRIGSASGLDFVNQRVGKQPPAEKPPVALTFTNRCADGINKSRLAQLTTESKTYVATTNGEIKPGDVPVNPEIELKIGARVMVAKNITADDGARVSNGALGEVIGFTADGPIVQLDSGNQLTAVAATWDKIAYEFNHEAASDKDKITESIKGQFSQVPLKLAYAITVHKSQGQTLESAVIEAENRCRTHGQLYVALSRVKSLEGLYLRRRLLKEDLVVHERVREFCGLPTPSTALPAVNLEAFGA